MSKLTYITLYADPEKRAAINASNALREARRRGSGLRAAIAYEKAAEAHQMAAYRRHCVEKLRLDQ